MLCIVISVLLHCGHKPSIELEQVSKKTHIIILGIVQDAGYPQLGCQKNCCEKVWKNKQYKKYVVSFALVDWINKKWWLFEASPDIKDQLQLFQKLTNNKFQYLPNGIFITHAHIGHYSGLMQFGKESCNSNLISVYVLPKLKYFLEQNGPWSQLVTQKNISIQMLDTIQSLVLQDNIQIKTFVVPHRDEFSETAGFKITCNDKKYLFIPDIDKWGKWNKNILEEVKAVDIAFLDATFQTINELNNRKSEDIPHPFVLETIELFKNEDKYTKSKIHFIHLNHTNKLLWDPSARKKIVKLNYNLALQGQEY